jgi:Bacterial toxin 44
VFAQPDPYNGSYDLTNPQSLHRYAYSQNDPVNSIDPSGLMPCEPGNYSAECGSSGFGGWGWGNLIDRPHLAGRRDIAEDERLNPYLETATPQGMIGIPFFLPEYFGFVPQDPCEVPDAPPKANLNENIKAAANLSFSTGNTGRPLLWGSTALGLAAMRARIFYELVKSGGPWDYKLQDKETRDYGRRSRYEDFGNFNFGATGTAAGFRKVSYCV